MVESIKQPISKWGDLLDEEDYSILVYSEVIGPDQNCIKIIIVYKYDSEGRIIKFTIKFRVRTLECKISKFVQECSKWSRFAIAAFETMNDHFTVQSLEDIFLEWTNLSNIKKSTFTQKSLRKNEHKIMPNLREMLVKKRLERQLLEAKSLFQGDEIRSKSVAQTKNNYIPPHLRATSSLGDNSKYRRENQISLRVSNLPEDTTDYDLKDLFGNFGYIMRVYIVVKENGDLKGYAFVNFFY